jgi:hypothetical protein
MGVTFNDTNTQHIDFGSVPGAVGLTQKSCLIWFYPTAVPADAQTLFFVFESGSGVDDYFPFLLSPANEAGKIGISSLWSGATAFWKTTNVVISANNLYHIAVTYDGSLTTNDPLFYVNGASQAVTEVTAPSGTLRTGTASNLFLGDPVFDPITGHILSVCYYNRILSAAEIAEAYASRKAIPSYRGLVFAPQLWGAAGLQTFDGATLGASNKIRDLISGAEGTPSGSPVGRGETYLRVR